jgi:hypothetical protein
MAIDYEFNRSALNGKMLGALWIVYGILRLIAAALMVVYSGTATVMFGALLVRVPDTVPMMELFHIFYFVAIVWTILSGILALLAGLALAAGAHAARTLSLIAGFLALPDLPLGIMLGAYTLIVFLRPVEAAVNERSAAYTGNQTAMRASRAAS